MLVFELKFESDFGKQVAVSLRWVEGGSQGDDEFEFLA